MNRRGGCVHDATQQPTAEPSTPTAAAVDDEPTQRIPRALIAALDTSPTAVDNSGDSGEQKTGAEPPAVSVWTTAQSSPAAQRKNKYTPESTAHPAKMLPEVVRHAVAHYTKPGELVLDPMCGIGTTLVEAVRLGRRAVGVEYEPHWSRLRTQISTSRGGRASAVKRGSTLGCSTVTPASS